MDVIYTDFSKAFDTVNHRILLHKLAEFGFSPKLVQLFHSYLQDRTQFVEYKGVSSGEYRSTSGVPQGSVLRPFLFLIFVNDIADNVLFSVVSLFADDLKIYRFINSENDCNKLQEDLRILTEWSNKNMMPFNLGKCEKISFTRKRIPIHFDYKIADTVLMNRQYVRDLGVMLDSKLSYNIHIDHISLKCKRILGFIKRNSINYTDFGTIKIIYSAFARSILEYSSLVWDPTTQVSINKIEKIQKSFLKYLYFRAFSYYPVDTTYNELLAGFEISSLQSRRSLSKLLFLWDMLNDRIKNAKQLSYVDFRIPSFNGRNTDLFAVKASKSPIDRTLALYNRIVREEPLVDIFYMLSLIHI